MCKIKTHSGEMKSMHEMLAAGQAVSSAAMHEQQAHALNPALAACGTLPGCRLCAEGPQGQLDALVKRVAPKIAEADLS